ncbi:MAG TPA: Lon-like protease helical domain-containing protein [Stellaceae bacterium]|nr:Lon-like protease helical domain-containing protein [Stellaceae bacterium]
MTKSTTGAVMPGPDFEPGRPLPARLLYRRCDPAELPFALCSELEEAPGLIGQERAVEAIQFAMRMRRKGYNVYALGASGTGRHGMIEDLLRARAQSQPTPPDWCYVNNFADPQQPRRGPGLELLTGVAAGLPDVAGDYPAGTLNQRIAARLDAFAAKAAEFAPIAFGQEARA